MANDIVIQIACTAGDVYALTKQGAIYVGETTTDSSGYITGIVWKELDSPV